MKAKITMVALLAALSTYGSSCMHEGILVPVNMTIGSCYAVPASPVVPVGFDETKTILLSTLIDESFLEKLKGVRYYDIRVRGTGAYGGNVAAAIYINGQLLMNIGTGTGNTTPVPWSTFATPQSLLGSSAVLRTNAAGVNALAAALNQFVVNPNTSVTLRAAGVATGAAPVPANLQVCFDIFAQADVSLND